MTNKIPFCFTLQANITVEEYAAMYKVYQRSVRQTETLKELQRIREEAKIKHESSFDIKPKGNKITNPP